MSKTKTKRGQYAVIGNERYGLYVGYVESFDTRRRVALVRE